MKTFAYTYRAHSGALKQASLQALDRHDALRQIKAQGLIPVSVKERKDHQQSALGHTFSFNRNWLFAMVAVLLVGVALVFFLPKAQSKTRVSTQKNVTSSKKKNPEPIKRISGDSQHVISRQQVPELPQKTRGTPNKEEINQENNARPPNPALANHSSETNAPEPLHFATMSEQMLALISSVPPGVPIAPLPDLSYWDMNQDLIKTATNVLFITETDDDKLSLLKEDVAWLKLDLIKFVDEGYSGSEILEAFHQDHNEKAELRFQISTQLNAEIDRGDSLVKILKDLPEINKALRDQKLPEITLGELGITTDDNK